MSIMMMREFVQHIQYRMEESIRNSEPDSVTVLAPTIFFATDTDVMVEWLTSKASRATQERFSENIEKLTICDGAVLRMSAASSIMPEGFALMEKVIPQMVMQFQPQVAIWAGSALSVSTEVVRNEEDIVALVRRLGSEWHEQLQEVLYVIAVDREVTQTWGAEVERDDDGDFAYVTEWEMVDPDSIFNLPYTEFTTPAQKALRSL